MVPAKDRVGCHDGCEFAKCFAAQGLPFDRQQQPLVIGQQDPFLPQFLEQSHNLIVLKLDHFLLPLVDPAGEDGQ